MTRKETKYLNNAYAKSIDNLQKNFFTDKSTGLTLFVEYLKYIRDFTVLATNNNSEEAKLKIATIITAIAEFEAYIQEQDSKRKKFHWYNFCELIKQNMEEWLKINDSV